VLVGEFDENVLKAGRKGANLAHGNAVVRQLAAKTVEREIFIDERMDGLPKDGGAPYPGNPAGQAQCPGHLRGGEFDAPRAMGLHLRKLA
jgi:hypothetical protein